MEPYFWFYIKNVGVPYLLIVLALFQRKQTIPADAADLAVRRIRRHNAAVRQYRLIAAGAFLILLIAEFIIFQPKRIRQQQADLRVVPAQPADGRRLRDDAV